jgi:hypothetical protein
LQDDGDKFVEIVEKLWKLCECPMPVSC